MYGGGAGLNIVEGNVMWNCGEAIQVVSDASPFDVGGYETDGLATNPGWKIVPGFKGIGGTNPLPPTTPTNLQLR